MGEPAEDWSFNSPYSQSAVNARHTNVVLVIGGSPDHNWNSNSPIGRNATGAGCSRPTQSGIHRVTGAAPRAPVRELEVWCAETPVVGAPEDAVDHHARGSGTKRANAVASDMPLEMEARLPD